MKATKASWTEVGVAGLRKARSVQVATPAAPNPQSLASIGVGRIRDNALEPRKER